MKRCFKCGAEKPLDEFYRHSQMGNGHLNKCKDCTRADVKARYDRLASTPEGLQAERRRGREKYWRLYAHDHNRRRVRNPNIAREWAERNPTKRAAQIAVGNAVRDGRLVRQPCEVCGDPKVDGHHDDYSKPLTVRWLCRRHHLALHRKAA